MGDVARPESRRARAGWYARGLPAEVTEFVGRVREVRQVRQLLGTSRLVTLIGVGGVGKTRLALRVAHEVRHLFPGGVWWADLIDVPETAGALPVEQAVAEAVGLQDFSVKRPREALMEYLRDRHCLLVLDNCEHLVEAAGALGSYLLRTANALQVLATSREVLGCPGEHVVHVPPMSITDGDDLSGVPSGEALELLRQRATAIGAPVAEGDLALAAELCRRLDGLPLAIELAAVRLGVLSLTEVLDRLEDRFELLSWGSRQGPATHQTLRRVLDWSYRLCEEKERLLWERASVFTGEFNLAAAEQVCHGEDLAQDEVLDALTGLVRQSLLSVRRGDGPARYRMLQTLRGYGLAALDRRGERTTYQRRHRDYYRRTVARAVRDWFGPQEVQWSEWVRAELPNLRAALGFRHTDADAVPRLELAVDLAHMYLWYIVGWLGEGRAWLRLALDDVHDPSPLRAAALAQAGWLSICQGDTDAARSYLAECHAVGSSVEGAAWSIDFLDGAYALVVETDTRCLAVLDRARQAGASRPGTTVLEVIRLVAHSYLGDREIALAASQKFLEEATRRGAPVTLSWAQWAAGVAQLRHGDQRRALTLMCTSLRSQWEMHERWAATWSIHGLAWALAAKLGASSEPGDERSIDIAQEVARVLGGAHRLRQYLGVNLAGIRPLHDSTRQAERAVGQVLDEHRYQQAFDQGACPDLDDPQAYDHVIAHALGDRRPAPLPSTAESTGLAPAKPLSTREGEIAALVAEGLNNLEIARKLVISHRTVQTHVANILRKRDLRNRQELAAWYAQRRMR